MMDGESEPSACTFRFFNDSIFLPSAFSSKKTPGRRLFLHLRQQLPLFLFVNPKYSLLKLCRIHRASINTVLAIYNVEWKSL